MVTFTDIVKEQRQQGAGVFSSLGSKIKVAQVCEKFYIIYKRDILQYLKSGNKSFDFGTGGLSDEDYQRVLTIVKNKPKF